MVNYAWVVEFKAEVTRNKFGERDKQGPDREGL